MKKISVIAVFAALLCMVSGCDFIRSIAGRPTSDQLAAADSSEVVCDQEELCPSDTLEACCPDSLECETPCTDSLRCASCGEEMDAIDPDDEMSDLDDELPAPAEEPAPVAEPAPAPAPEPVAVVEPKPLKNLSMVQITRKPIGQKAALDYKYYVLIGTFAKKENLDRQVARARKAGLEVEKITFSNGLVAVGVCPTDNFATAVSSLETLRKLDFCPNDAHIIAAE